MRLINIGFGNMVAVDRIVAVVNPDSAPVKRLIQEARDDRRFLDATQGRRTRAVILMSGNHIVLSAIQPETIASRASSKENEPHAEEKQD
jgi:extracellular matrix regulatory protein A